MNTRNKLLYSAFYSELDLKYDIDPLGDDLVGERSSKRGFSRKQNDRRK